MNLPFFDLLCKYICFRNCSCLEEVCWQNWNVLSLWRFSFCQHAFFMPG